MVPNVVLVLTTLAVLNSIGIVSSKDELEHGLATDCYGKSTYENIVKLSKVFQIC